MGGGTSPKRNPFSAGRWVTGSHFYGRELLIDRLLNSNESCDWVIGKRRVGKTSLLRQMEAVINEKFQDKFALFWDVQGSYDSQGLNENFHDAIEDSRDNFPDKWSRMGDIDFEAAPSYQAIKKWARSAQRHNIQCYLLIDEAEEFINIGKQDSLLLGKLRKTMQGHANLHTIISSTPRLEQFHKTIQTETSPFLHGFHVHYLGHFDHKACISLLKIGIESIDVCESIFQFTIGNPFETQLYAKHYFEEPNLESVALQLVANPSLIQEIEVNFELLTPQEQDILKEIFQGRVDIQDFLDSKERSLVSKLIHLGYLASNGTNQIGLGSHFMAHWMREKFSIAPFKPTQRKEDPALEPIHAHLIKQQIIHLYKIFLELAKSGKRFTNLNECFRVAAHDQIIYPDPNAQQCDFEIRKNAEWCFAITEIKIIIHAFCDIDSSWVLFRFHQMANEGPQNYTECEFLDLMALISEESMLPE